MKNWMGNRILVVMMAALLALAVFSGCAPDDDDPEEVVAEPDEPTEIVIAQGIDVQDWDIHDHNNTATEAVHVNLFDYLVWRNAEQELEPALAEDWEIIDDTTWKFELREGVTWHDGEPFTAEDVKFTLERVAYDDALTEHGQYNQIKEVEIIDDHTIRIITHEPEPVLLNRLCRLGSGILPKHFFDQYDDDDDAWEAWEQGPIGTGPYKFVEWRRDDRLVLEAFEDHWRGAPSIDRVTFRVIPEDSTRTSELLVGGIDIATMVPPADWERVKDEDGVRLEQAPSQRVMLLIVRHLDEFVTSDPLVREAVELAIDNEALVKDIVGVGIPCRVRLTPGNFGADPDLHDTYLYDPDRARELLAEAGYDEDNPPKIGLQVPRDRYPMDSEVGQAMAGMLEEVGFEVDLNILEWGAWADRRSAREHPDLTLVGFGNSLWDGFLCFNSLRWSVDSPEPAGREYAFDNEYFDELVGKVMVEMDMDRREEMLQEASWIVVEERPQIALYQLENSYGMSDRVDWSPRGDEMLPVRKMQIRE